MEETGKTRPRFTALSLTDCHTCLSGNRPCGRQRPYCATCLSRGAKCGGYATPLSWHSSRAYSGKASLRRPQQRLRQKSTAQTPPHRGDVSERQSLSISSWSEYLVEQPSVFTEVTSPITQTEACSIDATNVHFILDNFVTETYPGIDESHVSTPDIQTPSLSILPVPAWTDSATENNGITLCEEALTTVRCSSEAAASHAGSAPFAPGSLLSGSDVALFFEPSILESQDTHEMPDSWFDTFSLPSYDSWWQHEMSLKYYDTDLCILPLTSDLALNPFRIRGFAPEESQLLLQSVLALCSQHQVNIGNTRPTEALEKRAQVSGMLSQALQSEELTNKNGSLLEAILILFTLDCTISALGNWSDHIRKAATVFEAWGGSAALNSPRLRSQASMLVWWDVTLAMISRQGARFNPSYFDQLLKNEHVDGWSFYELTGCPTELVVFLVRLAEMARQKEMAESMEFLTFDMTAVLNVERQLLNWKNNLEVDVGSVQIDDDILNSLEEDAEGQDAVSSKDKDEDEYCRQRDDYNCIEAWRYALLLYIQRVFRWNRQSHRRPSAILPLTCKVLEHSRNCHKTSQVQKQLLLPMFLAGAESRDEAMRNTVREYCLYWGARSRYGMFYSVSSLLAEYWEHQLSTNASPVWWGSFLDLKSRPAKAGDAAPMQFLFG